MKRPRWYAGAASWRLHRAHTATPLMSVHKIVYAASSTVAFACMDVALCYHHCLLARLNSSADCERRGESHVLLGGELLQLN